MSLPSARVDQIRSALTGALQPRSLQIEDESVRHAGHAGAREGGHYRVVLVADAFVGLSQLQRHRLVYEAVGRLMGNGVHALSIVARTPEEAHQ
jgi:BolA family transcriptional regulator, general stress-responsive regulator